MARGICLFLVASMPLYSIDLWQMVSTVQTIDMQQKWSLWLAGCDSFSGSHMQRRLDNLLRQENEAHMKAVPSAGETVLPTLQEFRAANISGSAQSSN